MAVTLICAATAAAVTAFAPVAVKAKPNPVREFTPAASPSFFAWTQNSVAHPNSYNEYAQPLGGGAVVRVNTLNSQAAGGGIDGTRLVYQQIVKGQSDIRYFNLATHTHSNPPPGVNTPNTERLPTISGNWLMFGRTGGGLTSVLLFNLTTHSTRVLARVSSKTTYVEPGQVNGNWATYMQCSRTVASCWVARYDIAANTQTRISRPAGKLDSAPAIASDGTLYFDRSGAACGSNATIEELPVGGLLTALRTMSPGIDVQTMRVANDGTNDVLYYARITCRTSGDDIYRAIVS